MVVVLLQGGLGNQMFQYAAGRSLALRLGADLKMDRSYLDGTQMGNTPRRYELGSFDVVERFADRAEVAKWTARGETRFRTLLLRLLGAAGIRRPHPRVLRDPDFRFQPEFLSVSGDVYLEGYWQSERYFASVSDVIRREFSARNPLRGRDDELARTLEAENAVSVHVRRGDFVRRPETYEFHGVCGVEYYRRCMEIVSGSVVDPHFVVFTDEPGWARENLPPARRVTFVDWDAPRPGWVDLELMRRCRHHIVANSSFSWWGAWLCGNPGKRVLAPARWFNRPGMDTRDLLPASWTVV